MLAAVICAACPVIARGSEESTHGLAGMYTVRDIAALLGRRSRSSILPDSSLTDRRVRWAFRQAVADDALLRRLAVLTDSIRSETAAEPRPRITLRPSATAREIRQMWTPWAIAAGLRKMTESLDRPLTADEQANASRHFTYYRSRPEARIGLGLVRGMRTDQIRELVGGREVPIPSASLSDDDVTSLAQSIMGTLFDNGVFSKGNREHQIDTFGKRLRQGGIRLRIDSTPSRNSFHVCMLPAGSRMQVAIGRLSEDDLSLPLSGINPYREYEAFRDGRKVPLDDTRLSLPLLAGELSIGAASDWPGVMTALSEAAGLDVMTESYICRPPPRGRRPGPAQMVFARGTPLPEALNAICGRFGYIWWEERGCYYFLSGTWPSDLDYEVPPGLIRTWQSSLAKRGRVGSEELLMLSNLTPRQRVGLGRLLGVPGSASGVAGGDGADFLAYFRELNLVGQSLILGRGMPSRIGKGAALPGLARAFSGDRTVALVRLEQRTTSAAHAGSPAWKTQFTVHIGWKPGDGIRIPFEVIMPTTLGRD